MAEAVAIQALAFIAADSDKLGRFLVESGIGPGTLRTAAEDPRFLVGVLDFLLRDDSLVVAFADAAEIDPEHVASAREILANERPRS